jgi:hypothetical protein
VRNPYGEAFPLGIRRSEYVFGESRGVCVPPLAADSSRPSFRPTSAGRKESKLTGGRAVFVGLPIKAQQLVKLGAVEVRLTPPRRGVAADRGVRLR